MMVAITPVPFLVDQSDFTRYQEWVHETLDVADLQVEQFDEFVCRNYLRVTYSAWLAQHCPGDEWEAVQRHVSHIADDAGVLEVAGFGFRVPANAVAFKKEFGGSFAERYSGRE